MARGQYPELILIDPGFDRRAVFVPVGNEFIDADRIKDGARQNMSADLGSLFDDAYRHIMPSYDCELLEADRGRQTCGSAAYHNDVIFHRFTVVGCAHLFLSHPGVVHFGGLRRLNYWQIRIAITGRHGAQYGSHADDEHRVILP